MTNQRHDSNPSYATLPRHLWRDAVGPGYQASGVAIKGIESAIWPASIRLQRLRVSFG